MTRSFMRVGSAESGYGDVDIYKEIAYAPCQESLPDSKNRLVLRTDELLELLLPLAGEFLSGYSLSSKSVRLMLIIYAFSARQEVRDGVIHIWCHLTFNYVHDKKEGKLMSLIMDSVFEDRETLVPIRAVCHRKAYRQTAYVYDPMLNHWTFDQELDYE